MTHLIIPRKIVPGEMSTAEKERAMSVSREEYPQELPCIVCGFRWMQHHGTLCPKRPGYLDIKTMTPQPPILGDTTFIPDVAYLNQNPDFDVM